MKKISEASEGSLLKRATELFEESKKDVYKRTDRLFGYLMVCQWFAGIIAAIWISPRTWIGTTSQIHWHVCAGIFLGGIIASFPLFLIYRQPGHTFTRHVIGAGQMLFSALLIHLMGGRIETHFHIFGSLAFLAFYRDWRVLVTASAVAAIDHFTRELFWPQSIFGILTPSSWRWLEHVGWVIFEDTFLIVSIRQSVAEMFAVSLERSKLETVNTEIEHQVEELTVAHKNLALNEARTRLIIDTAFDAIITADTKGNILEWNPQAEQIFGWNHQEIIGANLAETIIPVAHREAHNRGMKRFLETRKGTVLNKRIEITALHKNGHEIPVEIAIAPIQMGKTTIFSAFLRDITEKKLANAKLDTAHKQLVDASRQAGMAEIATGILHNVGNVLNSVNVSTTLISDNLKKSKVGNLSKAMTLMNEASGDLGSFITTDPKGKQLPAYLNQLTEHLVNEQKSMAEEVNHLKKNVEHIRDIVAMQQNYAKAYGVTEVIQITDLVEDAFHVNTEALLRHEVDFSREYEPDLPKITVEKNKVLQILVNLIGNAKHACDDSGKTKKQISVKVSRDSEQIKISVSDNGIGIEPENINHIFNHGFTTRKNGHGFGLHSSALAAKEMKGSLDVHSDGIGQGATFTLKLPYNLTDNL